MVASQKRRPTSPENTTNTLLMFVGAASLIGFFLVGLNWGGKSEGKKTVVTANELHHREEAIRHQMELCHAKEQNIISGTALLDDSAKDLKDRNKKLDDRNKELYEEHSQQENEIAKCQEETETQITLFTDQDESTKRQLQNLHEEVELLQQSLHDLTHGYGMRTVLLSATLSKVEGDYKRLNKAVNDPEQFPLRTLDELLTHHAMSLERVETHSELRRQRVEGAITNWTHWRYDPANHTDIFLTTIDSDGEVIRPAALDRVGTPPVKVVRRMARPGDMVATSSLAEQIVSLNDFALCAMKLQSPNFTFPNTFYWHYRIDSDKSFLANIVDTPLLVFCENCNNRRKSSEFKIACNEELAAARYGGHDYWVARSLIRFQPSVEHEADNFAFANDLKGKKYLSVVLHSSAETYEKCEAQINVPGMHYLYVRGNFEEDTTPLNRDVDVQCAPTWEQIVERIKEAIKDADEYPFEAVYLSIEPESMERVKYEDLPGMHIVMMEQKNAFDEAVDIVVAARGTRILVSPYLPQSQVVTEMFLMNNQLSPNHNVQFF